MKIHSALVELRRTDSHGWAKDSNIATLGCKPSKNCTKKKLHINWHIKCVIRPSGRLIMNVASQRQHCLKQGTIFSKVLLLLQHNTKDEIFLSSVKEDKPASGTTKTQELFNPIVCSYLHLGYLSLSSSFKSYILSNFYRAIWDKLI